MVSIQDGRCPECSSSEIFYRTGWFNNVITLFLPPKTRVCVCGACGYIAEFVDPDHLEHIRQNWKRLETRPLRKNEEIEPFE